MTTYQECLYKDKAVYVVGMTSRSGKVHRYVRKFVGRTGWVIGQSKNGMLLLEFKKGYGRECRAIPAGCVQPVTEVEFAKKSVIPDKNVRVLTLMPSSRIIDSSVNNEDYKMARKTKMTIVEVIEVMKDLSDNAFAAYGDYSYLAGYLGSFCTLLLADLPAARQAEEIARIRRAAKGLGARGVAQ